MSRKIKHVYLSLIPVLIDLIFNALFAVFEGTILRGGPLDILGGGLSDPKKKFMQEIELEKKIPACA